MQIHRGCAAQQDVASAGEDCTTEYLAIELSDEANNSPWRVAARKRLDGRERILRRRPALVELSSVLGGVSIQIQPRTTPAELR